MSYASDKKYVIYISSRLSLVHKTGREVSFNVHALTVSQIDSSQVQNWPLTLVNVRYSINGKPVAKQICHYCFHFSYTYSKSILLS
jgi:hypothetical protein